MTTLTTPELDEFRAAVAAAFAHLTPAMLAVQFATGQDLADADVMVTLYGSDEDYQRGAAELRALVADSPVPPRHSKHRRLDNGPSCSASRALTWLAEVPPLDGRVDRAWAEHLAPVLDRYRAKGEGWWPAGTDWLTDRDLAWLQKVYTAHQCVQQSGYTARLDRVLKGSETARLALYALFGPERTERALAKRRIFRARLA